MVQKASSFSFLLWHLKEKKSLPARKDNSFENQNICAKHFLRKMAGSNMIYKYAKTCKSTGAILLRYPFVFVAASLHKPQGRGLKAGCSECMRLQVLCCVQLCARWYEYVLGQFPWWFALCGLQHAISCPLLMLVNNKRKRGLCH